MNNRIEMNELDEMRKQLATLKKQLESQEIVNERLIKEAMSRKLSALNNSAVWICIISLIFIPLGYYVFHRSGMSDAFCIATSCVFFVSFVATFISHYRIRKRDIYCGSLITVYKEVTRMRKIYKRWHYYSIPLLVVWFVWLEYEVYIYLAHEDFTTMMTISTSGIIGGIIGGTIGLRLHKRSLRTADDLLHQIEELQKP